MSPEQVNEEKYNHKSDIWSLGCIIYEAAALRPPFQAENFLTLAMKINKGTVCRIPKVYSEDLQSVINEMLDKDPGKRPSVEDLIQKNPKVNIKVKEFKIKEWKEECLRKDKLLKEKERELIEKSKILDKRLAAIEAREKKVAELEDQYKNLVNLIMMI
jgi:NIMA (never in mitosis gene a)-related kinase